MTSTINDKHLPTKMNLYRGVSNPGAFLQDPNWNSKSLDQLRAEYVGKVAVDDGFCSTSTSRGTAQDFANTINGTVVEITAPKGANAMCMKDLSGFDEKEVLLQKGSGFKIKSIDYDPMTGYRIKADLIGRK